MEQYNIRIYKKAQNDLEEIVQYLNRFYSETALKYYDLIISEVIKLSVNPKHCTFVRDDILKIKGYRYLLVENYVVFFVIKGNTIQIRRILYNKQQYKNLLFSLLKRTISRSTLPPKNSGIPRELTLQNTQLRLHQKTQPWKLFRFIKELKVVR